jgi:hypothetical protein
MTEQQVTLIGILLTFLLNAGGIVIAWNKMLKDVESKQKEFLAAEEERRKTRELEEKRLAMEAPERKANTESVASKTMQTALESIRREMKEKDEAHERDRLQFRADMQEQDKRHETERENLRSEIAMLRVEQVDRDRRYSNEIASLKSQIVEYVNGVDILIEQVSKYETPKYIRRKTGPLGTSV